MKKKNKLKKIIMGSVGFAMAVIVFFVGSMQSMREVEADIRVFDKITEKYPHTGNSFKFSILEIVPDNAEASKEMGYFLQSGSRMESPTNVTYGTVHSPIFTSRDDARYPDALYNLRTYGLIKATGADGVGAYPIYAMRNGTGIAVFSNFATAESAVPYPNSYVKGVYEVAAGDYNIADGYTIDDDGRICKVEQVQVSGNGTLSGNGVSGNTPTYTTVLTPVTDIDLTKLSLPTSNTGFAYVTVADPSGSGNLKFTRSETVTSKMQYYGLSDQALYYMKDSNAYFYSSDYFREYVFGSRTKYANKQITYNTVKASDVTTSQIASADLVYISGKSIDFELKGNDITEEVLLEIYNQEVNNHKAIMMDYASYSATAKTNVSKLAALLWRESQSEIRTEYADVAFTDADEPDMMQNVSFMDDKVLKDLKASMMTGANGNFVTGNVYVYNHHMSDFDDPKSMIDAGDIFANGDFNSAYKTDVTQNGFSAVLNYIVATNKNSTTGTMLPSVTPAVVIQYILISDGNPLTIVKTSLNVLEIQPVTSFLFNETRGCEEYGYLDENSKIKKNRDEFVMNYLNNYYDDKAEYIQFTSMTIDEFNGKNDDLVESYDIIYIGSETGKLYSLADLTTRAKDGDVYSDTKSTTMMLPVYEDTNMNGMVYYNIGDTVMTKERDTQADLAGHLDIDTLESRFNGRDLTKDKLQKLEKYLQANGLVIVEGDLMARNSAGVVKINPSALSLNNSDTVDHGRVDTSSYMYEFLKFSQGYLFNYTTGQYENASQETNETYQVYNNLVSVGDLDAGSVTKTDIEQYIATEKLALTMTKQPEAYSYSYQADTTVLDPASITYLSEESGGKRKLVYEFVISSLASTAEVNPTYIPSLYIDVNKDGKYSEIAENVRDIQIVVKASGQEAPRDAGNNYLLNKDVEYQMTRELDDSFSGYLQWKLNIQSVSDPNVHVSEQGNTVVKNKGQDKVIKILQISKEGGTLLLEKQAEDPNSKFAQYLNAVPGYKVVFRTMTSGEFVKDFNDAWNAYKVNGKKSVEEYALEYFDTLIIAGEDTTAETDDVVGANMLVFGYGDNYESIDDDNAVKALKAFIESEKPVLMAHDFMHYNATHNQSAYLRNMMGADKYGVTLNIRVAEDGVTFKDLIAKKIDTTGKAYLHSGVAYTRSANGDVLSLMEATGKTVAYQPSFEDGKAREMTAKQTQGISNYTLEGFQENGNKWLNSDKVPYGNGDAAIGRGSYQAEKINEGQITSYPYLLPNSFAVQQTHAQHLTLDLDIDEDNDGETDIVVWYALGKKTGTIQGGLPDYDAYADDAAGPVPADGYYVYNKGNITYTGYGDGRNLAEFTDDEAQLFVNTLFAAFNAEQTAPTAGFYETAPDADDAPITSVSVPYDENVTGERVIDSSVLRKADGTYMYHFVNPNVYDAASKTATLRTDTNISLATPIYYRLSDTNFVRGQKYMTVEYYLKAEGNNYDAAKKEYKLENGKNSSGQNYADNTLPVSKININNTEVPVVDITDYILTYQVSEGRFATTITPDATTKALSFMESGVTYGFYLPMSILDESSQFTIYVKASTRVITESSQTGLPIVTDIPGEGYSELTITKTDLLDLD